MAPSWGSTPRASLPRFGPAGPRLLGGGSLNSGSGGPCSRHRGFLGKLHKTKVEEHPRYSRGGSGHIRPSTSPRGPAHRPRARGRSAAVVPGLTELKLGRCFTLMGTWPHIYFGPIGPHPTPGGEAKEWFWRPVEAKRCVSGKTI